MFHFIKSHGMLSCAVSLLLFGCAPGEKPSEEVAPAQQERTEQTAETSQEDNVTTAAATAYFPDFEELPADGPSTNLLANSNNLFRVQDPVSEPIQMLDNGTWQTITSYNVRGFAFGIDFYIINPLGGVAKYTGEPMHYIPTGNTTQAEVVRGGPPNFYISKDQVAYQENLAGPGEHWIELTGGVDDIFVIAGFVLLRTTDQNFFLFEDPSDKPFATGGGEMVGEVDHLMHRRADGSLELYAGTLGAGEGKWEPIDGNMSVIVYVENTGRFFGINSSNYMVEMYDPGSKSWIPSAQNAERLVATSKTIYVTSGGTIFQSNPS